MLSGRNKQRDGSFLPTDYVASKQEHRSNFMALVLFSIVIFSVVSAFMFTNRQWASVRQEQKQIDAAYESETRKIDQLKAIEGRREKLLDKAEITTALIDKVPRSVLLAELVTDMPRDVTLEKLELESKRIKPPKPDAADKKVRSLTSKRGSGKKEEPEKPKVLAPSFEFTLKITGVAGDNNAVADYLQALKECTLLDSIELKYISATHLDEMTLRKFEIEARIRDGADATALATVERDEMKRNPMQHKSMANVLENVLNKGDE